jgi:hypothetical protein
MFDQLGPERGVPRFVYHSCRGTKLCKRRQKLQERGIEVLARCVPPPRVIPLPHARHIGGTFRWNEAREHRALRMPTCQLRYDRQHSIHPRGGPWTFRRKEALHVHAKVDRSAREWIGVQFVRHVIEPFRFRENRNRALVRQSGPGEIAVRVQACNPATTCDRANQP